VFTVGHSTRALSDFLALLRAHGVAVVVDVRKIPRSGRHPHFSIDTLPSALAAAGIAYTHAPSLGGLRRSRPDSVNRGWRNVSFRAYADYMQTPEFAAALDDLVARAAATPLAVM